MLTTECISNLILTHLCVYLFHWCFSEALSCKAIDFRICLPKAFKTDRVRSAKGILWQDFPASISQEVCCLHIYEEIWLALLTREGKGRDSRPAGNHFLLINVISFVYFVMLLFLSVIRFNHIIDMSSLLVK